MVFHTCPLLTSRPTNVLNGFQWVDCHLLILSMGLEKGYENMKIDDSVPKRSLQKIKGFYYEILVLVLYLLFPQNCSLFPNQNVTGTHQVL